MAWAKRREQWDHTCAILAVLSSERVDPNSLNPIRRMEVEKLARQSDKRGATNEAMMLIGVALGDKEAVQRWQCKGQATGQAEAAEKSALGKPTSN